MTSTATARNRLNKQGTGDNSNTWGEKLNNEVFDLIDTAMDGWTTKALTVDVALTSANYVADEARSRVLSFTGPAAFVVTVPAVEKVYLVKNGCTGDLTIASSGGGATAVLIPGEVAFCITNGVDVFRQTLRSMSGLRLQNVGAPTANSDAATKKYVDDTAFGLNTGILPGQPGNEGKSLNTNGSTPSWGDPPRLMRRNLFFDKRLA